MNLGGLDGLPHVTAILKEAGLIDASHFTERARDLGTAVHAATQYLDEGDLDEAGLEPLIRPRLEAYKAFLREIRPTILCIETAVHHPIHQYVGRCDRLVTINQEVGVLDIKGPGLADWHGLQTEAYRHCIDPMPTGRWTLHLSDDGYKLVEHRRRDDWPAFLAALTLYNWRRNHA